MNALDAEANGSRGEWRRVVVGLQPRRDGGVDGGGEGMRGGHVCQVEWAEVGGRLVHRGGLGYLWCSAAGRGFVVSRFRGFACRLEDILCVCGTLAI